MAFEILNVLQEQTIAETPAQAMARQARQAAERDERQAERDEAERAAALEDAAETRAFAFRQLNIQPGQALDAAMQSMDEDGEYEAARATMEKIERRRARRQEAMRWQGEQLAMASRARTTGLPPGIDAANELAARLRVEQMLAGPARSRERRPFAVRGAVRAEQQCVYCDAGNVDPETSFLLHADPQFAVPVTTADQATPEDIAEARDGIGRNRAAAYNRHPAVRRLAAAYEAEDRRRWEDERSLRVAHGGGEGLAVREGGPIVGVR